MKSANKTTQFFIFLGIFMTTFGIAKFDASNLSLDHNQRSYFMFSIAVISLIIAYVRLRKEKSVKTD